MAGKLVDKGELPPAAHRPSLRAAAKKNAIAAKREPAPAKIAGAKYGNPQYPVPKGTLAPHARVPAKAKKHKGR